MPTETTKPRLIDANAFIANLEKVEKEIRKGELPKRYLAGLVSCIAYAKSAPTVETTDDVLANLPEKSLPVIAKQLDGKYQSYCKRETAYGIFTGDTAFESLKSFEASINRK